MVFMICAHLPYIYVAWYYRECDHRNCTYVNGFRSLTPVDSWVFLVGQSLPSVPDGKRFDQMFATLAAKFSKVQYFGSYRVVGYDAWARARNGRIERVFAFVGDVGEVFANLGRQSPKVIFDNAERIDAEEQRMAAAGQDRPAAQKVLVRRQRHPVTSEEDTMAVAGAWSVDPSLLEQRHLAPSAGFVVVLPQTLRD